MAVVVYTHTGLGVATFSYHCNDLASDKGYFKKEIMFNKSIIPLVIAFLIIGGVILGFRTKIESLGFNWQVLSGGNLFIYLITVFSMQMLSKGLHAENTQVFLRNAYGGIMLKLFACAAAAFIYIVAAGDRLNKSSLLACMGFYLVYTGIELSVIMKQSKAKRNVKN